MTARLIVLKLQFLFSAQVAVDDILGCIDWQDGRLDRLVCFNLALDACCIVDVEYPIILQDWNEVFFGGRDLYLVAVLILSLFLAVGNHREENDHLRLCAFLDVASQVFNLLEREIFALSSE